MSSCSPKAIVLDAMGVLYRAEDDVAELLVPFVREHGGAPERVESEYLRASRGEISATEFWIRTGVDPALEDAFLARHELGAGVMSFLAWADARGHRLACLSNDVNEWSVKLRRRFGLDARIEVWVISGDVGVRKPDSKIYEILRTRMGIEPGEMIFLDDRRKNLDAARECGFLTLQVAREATGGHAYAADLLNAMDHIRGPR